MEIVIFYIIVAGLAILISMFFLYQLKKKERIKIDEQQQKTEIKPEECLEPEEEELVFLYSKEMLRNSANIKISDDGLKKAVKFVFYKNESSENCEEEIIFAPHLKNDEEKKAAATELINTISAALARVNSEKTQCPYYFWNWAPSCKDHSHMHGTIIKWDCAASPELLSQKSFRGNYHPGTIYGCYCFAQTLPEGIKSFKPPYNYYDGKKIVTLSKKELNKLCNIQKRK